MNSFLSNEKWPNHTVWIRIFHSACCVLASLQTYEARCRAAPACHVLFRYFGDNWRLAFDFGIAIVRFASYVHSVFSDCCTRRSSCFITISSYSTGAFYLPSYSTLGRGLLYWLFHFVDVTFAGGLKRGRCYRFFWHRSFPRFGVVAIFGVGPHCHRVLSPNCRALVVACDQIG